MKKDRPSKTINVDAILPKGWLKAIDPNYPTLGLGMDVGTTTNKKSNPSVLVLCQKVGFEKRFPLVVRWKSKDPDVAEALILAVLAGLLSLGLRARRLAIDATSEKYFAATLRKRLASKITVELIVSSENTEHNGEVMLWKIYLGNLLSNEVEDGYAALPNAPWVKDDLRSVTRNKGSFDAEILEDGGHGDVFDGSKLALHAVGAKGGPAKAEAAAVGSLGAGRAPVRKGVRNPFAAKFGPQATTRRAI